MNLSQYPPSKIDKLNKEQLDLMASIIFNSEIDEDERLEDLRLVVNGQPLDPIKKKYKQD